MRSLYAYSPNIWPSIISIMFMLVLAVYSLRHRNVPGALPFSIACMLGVLWSIGTLCEYAAVDLELKIFWRKFQVVMQLPSATAITCFLLEYAQPRRWLTRRNLILLSVVPVLAILIILTNPIHNWFWKGFDYDGGLVAISGQLMPYFIAYVFVNFLMNLVIFVWLFIHSPQNRWPVVIMVVGQVMMRLFYFIDFADRSAIHIPYSAVGIAITSLMYAIVFFRFQILGPISLARKAVIEQLPIGMLVVNEKGRIHALNPAAEHMLNVTKRGAKGLEVADVLPTGIKNYVIEGATEPIEFEYDIGDSKRYLRLNVSILKDWRDLEVGRLFLLRDISDQRKAQEKIIEQQRALAALKERELLARELHDDLAQVLSFIKTQGQTVQRLMNRGEQVIAKEYLDRLVEVSHQSEVDIRESILGMRLSSTDVSLAKTLKKYVDQYQKNHQIQTKLFIPEIITEKRLDPMVELQLLRILQEALTNIGKHAEAKHVKIIFDVNDNILCISVEDDGKGFDFPEDQQALENHFGLKMMHERAELIGSKIRLTTQPGCGTEISVCVPIDESWMANG